MTFPFTNYPFTTDIAEFIDLSKVFKRKDDQEAYVSWAFQGKEVLNIRQTICGGFSPEDPRSVDGVVTPDTFNKFFDRHTTGEVNELLKKVGVKLFNDGWVCMSLHQRPDGALKMEWIINKQVMMTFNVYIQ